MTTSNPLTALLGHYGRAAIGTHNTPLGKFGPMHIAVCVISLALAIVRHYFVLDQSFMAVFFGYVGLLLLLGMFNLRFMVLYAMLSTVVDVVWLAAYPVAKISTFTAIWEAVVMFIIGVRSTSVKESNNV